MASIEEQITGLERRLEELVAERGRVTEAITVDQRALEEEQARLESLGEEQQAVESDVAAARQLADDVDVAAGAVSDAHARADDELTQSQLEFDALSSRVELELSDDRRAALTNSLQAVDDAIADADADAARAVGELQVAEQEATTAEHVASTAAKKHADTLQRLRTLPQDLDAARTRIATLRAAATDAAGAGRMAEAFVRLQDLRRAIDALSDALRSSEHQQLVDSLPGLLDASRTRAGEAVTATAGVASLKEAAATAQATRDALIGGRDEKIAVILAEPAQAPQEPAAPGGDADTGPDAGQETEAEPEEEKADSIGHEGQPGTGEMPDPK